VRQQVASSLTQILFQNPAVIPALLKSLRDDAQRNAVLEALRNHLETTSATAEFSRVRTDLPKLKAVLGAAIPALVEAQSQNSDEISPAIFSLQGRVVSFSRVSRDGDLRKAIEPALQVYLRGRDESDPAIRSGVLGRLQGIPIRRTDIVAALKAFLERSDLSAEDRRAALLALQAQDTSREPKNGSRLN
jgi:hypothetical protein